MAVRPDLANARWRVALDQRFQKLGGT
jgi:hypothetical protein